MSTIEVYKLMGINKYLDSLRSRSLLGIHRCCQVMRSQGLASTML
ncbi:MAG: hypothetical protein RM049_29195 [Nostoc sp. DedQUE04]|nr:MULTISPECIES: hypothetical protein [unclassified Nostoc]MDZ8092311.1 hypothetical protein [Nostoc sp. DedQUE05]MDZ8139314.1 hypothetical protein [Nostoc sp. DedQUE04]